jgi:hypothetical protein
VLKIPAAFGCISAQIISRVEQLAAIICAILLFDIQKALFDVESFGIELFGASFQSVLISEIISSIICYSINVNVVC